MSVHILQIELNIPMVPIPHLCHNGDLLVMVVDSRNRSIHFLQRLVEEVHILNDTLKKKGLALFLPC